MWKLITLIGLVCWFVPSAHAGEEHLLAAAGKTAITPSPGSYLAGYGADRKSTGKLDELWVKAVVISDGAQYIALLTVDTIGLTRPDILRIRALIAATAPSMKVVVSSTHTHAGPDVVGIWGAQLWRSGRDESYIDSLVSAAAELVLSLVDQLKPVRSYVSSGQVTTDWVKNLSEPGVLDQRMSVLQFVDFNGLSVATLTNFACHPTILGPDNTLVSADYVGGFYTHMATNLSGEHLFLQGAIGGWVQPLQGDRSIGLARQMGAQVAQDSLLLLQQKVPNPVDSLVFKQAELDIELDNWGFRLLIALGVLQRDLVGGWFGWQAMRTEIAYFTVGAVEFVTHPGETSPAYSIATRALLTSAHNFVLGLSQDAIGYIVKPAFFSEAAKYPHADYLTSVSVGAQAGPQLMRGIEELVTQTSSE